MFTVSTLNWKSNCHSISHCLVCSVQEIEHYNKIVFYIIFLSIFTLSISYYITISFLSSLEIVAKFFFCIGNLVHVMCFLWNDILTVFNYKVMNFPLIGAVHLFYCPLHPRVTSASWAEWWCREASACGSAIRGQRCVWRSWPGSSPCRDISSSMTTPCSSASAEMRTLTTGRPSTASNPASE